MGSNPFTPLVPPEGGHTALTFDPDDARAMHQYGLITPPDSRGFVRVSRRRLREPSSSEDSAIATPSPPAITNPNESFEIPYSESSAAYFVWLGFTPHVAQKLHQDLTQSFNQGPEAPSTGLQIARSYVKRCKADADGSNDDWISAFRSIGISIELEKRMMDPEFDDVRVTATLKYWLIDTFGIRQRALEDIKIKSVERKDFRSKKRAKMGKQMQESEDKSAGESSKPQLESLAAEPKIEPGHLLLWKGLDTKRTENLLDRNGHLMDLGPIVSDTPNDFCSQSAWYFTQSKHVAERYALWAAQRSSNKDSNVCLVAMQVPNDLLSSLDIQKFRFPHDCGHWQQTVWTCRRGGWLPSSLAHIAHADVIIGPICGSHNNVIRTMSNFHQLGVQNVVVIPGTGYHAKQHVFLASCKYRLEEACKKTVSLH
ncbi:MAG: hypothetical protein M1831_002004 [Alyxoria varia]|nr:MAG: hypothetical protein M1831_002004 [Alyxoria varia]